MQDLLAQFPFLILGFHADNGSEYINKQVAALLEKLRIEFTKSRSRKTNDNALVEGATDGPRPCHRGAPVEHAGRWGGAHCPAGHGPGGPCPSAARYFEVERERIDVLRAELDAHFNTAESQLETPEVLLSFVRHPRAYSLRHNSNTAMAGWLETLGCRVRGPAILAHWHIDRRHQMSMFSISRIVASRSSIRSS